MDGEVVSGGGERIGKWDGTKTFLSSGQYSRGTFFLGTQIEHCFVLSRGLK